MPETWNWLNDFVLTAPSIAILLITGSPSPAIAAHAAALGINRVLDKAPTEEALLDFINAARS